MPTAEIDDSHSSTTYSGPWKTGGTSNEFQLTTHYTRSAGATMSVTFEGIAIAVYGTTSSTMSQFLASSRYSVDGEVFSIYKSPNTTQFGYHAEFFKSPTLSDGRHSLLVETLTDSAFFCLDSFVITTPDKKDVSPQSELETDTHTVTEKKNIITPSPSSPPPSLVPPPPSPSLSLPLSSSPPMSLLPLPSPLPNSSSSAQQTIQTGLSSTPLPVNTQPTLQATAPTLSPPKQVPIGAIIGATAAGVIVIVAALFVLWRHRYNSKKYTELSKWNKQTDDTPDITPFVGSDDPQIIGVGIRSPLRYHRDPPSPDAQNNTHNNFTWSAPDSGRVTKSPHPSSSTSVDNPPISGSLLEARTQSPLLNTRNEGGLEYGKSIAGENLPPPAYYEVMESQP